MNKHIAEQRAKKRAVMRLVAQYRETYDLALRGFAEALTDVLSEYGEKISYQTIKNWGDGRYFPNPFKLLQISQESLNWQGDFAEDMLAVLYPETYSPTSEIGRRVVLEMENESA